MTQSFSRYLDLFRVLACLVVVLSHLGHGHMVGGFLWPFTYLGNEAVMAFFVLSGFVIAYVSDQRERALGDYAAARLARLYSVVIPAMLLTLLLDTVGQFINAGAYVRPLGNLEHGKFFNYAISAAMLNQSWGANLHFGSNGAYWSIPYEFWYYVIFGAVTKLNGWKRITAAATALTIAGPNILLLLPIWLLGVGAYYLTKIKSNKILSNMLVILTTLGLLLLLYKDFSTLGGYQFLEVKADSLAWQYIVGILVALHIYGATITASYFESFFEFIKKPLVLFSSGTLALYLFHLPILEFIHAAFPGYGNKFLFQILLITIPLLVTLTIGVWSEKKKSVIKKFILEKWQ